MALDFSLRFWPSLDQIATLGPVSCGQVTEVRRWLTGLYYPGGEQGGFSQKGVWLGKQRGSYLIQEYPPLVAYRPRGDPGYQIERDIA